MELMQRDGKCTYLNLSVKCKRYASYNNVNNATFDAMYGYWNVPDAPQYWPFPDGPDQVKLSITFS